ncbi:hypothetical protein [Streptomyces parvus]|uniref:hypothetical protein n=1 Tax=Streptomyces parvus TaxID=66428 RepID=UPI002101C335|nr:hypothetical protein [Streptomyces parvus]MCQ1580439.1 hypothetical protein [Streptomyces parvus]
MGLVCPELTEDHTDMPLSVPVTPSLIAAEDALIAHLRQHAELLRSAHAATREWRYPSQFHLLLDLGRRFAPVPRPADLVGMPDRRCYSNAAQYALEHEDEGVVYAEGFAQTHEGLDFYLPHAWVALPDGTALDPTWDDQPGRAYVGVPVADRRLWPFDGGGLFQDFDRTLPLLRDGIPREALAELGRPMDPSNREARPGATDPSA